MSKAIVVSGSSRGIGAAVVRRFFREGFDVVINYCYDESGAEHLARELTAQDGSRKVIVQRGDVRKFSDMEELRDRALKEIGKVDVVVANAGINRDRSFGKLSEAEWQDVIETNLYGTFNLFRAFTDQFRKQKAGALVAVGSIVGHTGNFGQTNYAASKAGIVGLVKSLALELAAFNVSVNAVCPGFTDTAMVQALPSDIKETLLSRIPMRRFATVDEIAEAVRFLAHPDCRYMTGQTLNVNGGLFLA